MKFPAPEQPAPRGRRADGFTLTEMMLVVGIFAVIILGMIAVQIIALRVATLTTTKLTGSTGARQILNALRDQVRSAQTVAVGTYATNASPAFVQTANGAAQAGNALRIYCDGTGTNYVIYYLDTTLPTNAFFSVSNGVLVRLAQYVTNYYCFFAEDYQGNVLTNYTKNPAIHVVLQFDQWEYPAGALGVNGSNAHDLYRLETRVSRRAR